MSKKKKKKSKSKIDWNTLLASAIIDLLIGIILILIDKVI